MGLLIDQSSLVWIIVPTSIISIVLASIFAGQSFRIYSVSQSRFLLGLVIGFSSIAAGDFFLLITTTLQPILESDQYNLMYWYRLIFSSAGFAFVALTYHHRNKQDDDISLLRIGVVTVIIVGIILFLSHILVQLPNPIMVNPPNFLFRLFNVMVLAYVVRATLQHVSQKNGWIHVPFAFMILLLGQFSVFIFSIDGSIAARIASNILRDIGLFILVWSIFAKKDVRTSTSTIRS